MITWNEERVIPVNIDTVWALFDDENLKRIMPNVVQHTPIEKKEGMVGSTYQQSYKEGRRVETYVVEYREYEDTENRKHQKIAFTLGKAFEIEAAFTMIKIDETTTRFVYTGQNKGVNFLGKVMLKIAGDKNNDKVVHDFMEKVEKEALQESTSAKR
ncbi:SRPBCC family protein [Fictibacillus nanhaiensis]|uniref:SRPBCC family protein n=1 Tax=Fictibacillus nanhaiensis TaxID=742169 RepID=UPI001C97A1B4|nr:SRPBCC family protein [Fictibacillus nanhaiensis]MBY6038315.1 SRPBCC family protein [Fictibacillus nanhaiensis]